MITINKIYNNTQIKMNNKFADSFSHVDHNYAQIWPHKNTMKLQITILIELKININAD